MTTAIGQAKPFLKWAGGKSQLIEQITMFLPPALKTGRVKNYYEPFLGGGALFFWLAAQYDFKSIYLCEINPLITFCYQIVRQNVGKLIRELKQLEVEYLAANERKKEDIYYNYRNEFNAFGRKNAKKKSIRQSALLIFLNKTCFNGLYRVNSQGEFNVPFGRYKNPTICNEDNLRAASGLLQRAEIICSDFTLCVRNVDDNSFVYFDPPYRPISPTASFTSYSKDSFDDKEQLRLRKVYGELDKKGAFIMLSNSDPKNVDPKDNFFDDLYRGFRIERLSATRLINCNAERRGIINEILVMNY